MQYFVNYSLKKHNSFRLNSIAGVCYFPQNEKDLKEVINKKIPIIAGGTNVLLSPYIEEVVCLNYMPKYINKIKKSEIQTSATFLTSNFISKCALFGVTGLEGLFGIPGTIGGAVVMNAGSGIHTITDYVKKVKTINSNGTIKTYNKKDLYLARRYSILQDKNEIVTEVTFKLNPGQVNTKKLEAAKKHRRNFPKYPSAGGMFKNWHALKPYKDQLIGLKVGGAEVSQMVNIIINKHNACFEDIIKLINKIEEIVPKKLEKEIKVIK